MENICKYNQSGYCKFGHHCEKIHNNEICSNLSHCKTEYCNKRHPRVCKNYKIQGKCRFKEDCAYQDVQKAHEENLLVVQILASHFKEVAELKQELNELTIKVYEMENQINTQNIYVNAVEVCNETDKTTTKESHTNQEKILKIQQQCDVCKFQCENEITLKKHKNTKHPNMGQKISVSTQRKSTTFNCDECDHSSKTKKSLKKHKTHDHQNIIKSQDIKCENCGKVFSIKQDLEIHMKEQHPKCQCTAEDVCDDCLEEWQDK